MNILSPIRSAPIRGVTVLLLLGVVACHDTKTTGLANWTAADHDPAPAATQTSPSPAGGAGRSDAELAAELTWDEQCATCHGAEGRGDGPQGPLFHPPDLSRPKWQASVTDAAIASAITTGRGAMPKFNLSPQVVRELVVRVRALGAR